MCTKVELEILLLICYYGFSEIKEGAQLFLLKLLQSFCMFCYYFVVNDFTNHKMSPPLSAKCMQCNLKSMQFPLCTFQRSLHLCRLHYYAPLPLELVETHLENASPPQTQLRSQNWSHFRAVVLLALNSPHIVSQKWTVSVLFSFYTMVTFIAREIAFLNLVEIWQTKIKIEKFER